MRLRLNVLFNGASFTRWFHETKSLSEKATDAVMASGAKPGILRVPEARPAAEVRFDEIPRPLLTNSNIFVRGTRAK